MVGHVCIGLRSLLFIRESDAISLKHFRRARGRPKAAWPDVAAKNPVALDLVDIYSNDATPKFIGIRLCYLFVYVLYEM